MDIIFTQIALFLKTREPETIKPEPERSNLTETRTRSNPKLAIQIKPVQPEPESLDQTSTRTRKILNPTHHYSRVLIETVRYTKVGRRSNIFFKSNWAPGWQNVTKMG